MSTSQDQSDDNLTHEKDLLDEKSGSIQVEVDSTKDIDLVEYHDRNAGRLVVDPE